MVKFALLLVVLHFAADHGVFGLLPNKCPAVQIPHGRVRYRQRGRFVKFICNVGFTLAGDKFSTCIRGVWDTEIPRCVRPTCPEVKSLPNGFIYKSHAGAVVNFFCVSDFQLRGSNISYCDGKQWSSNLPSCIKSNMKPAYECDFEREDLCGWLHDVNHDFDWRRMQFSTPSGHVGTGPSYDHTKGFGQGGYYMYIESSSRSENDTARLISPVYNATQTDTCFQFFYHMYGRSIGTLRVYLHKIKDSWQLDPTTAFFSKSGNQGDNWYKGFHNLGIIDQDFQIVIEGVRGSSYVSDIAIDDVKIIENCTQTDLETTTEPVYSETYPIIESCENRCGNASSTVQDGYQISCDCDENCVLNNTCCPDYMAMCIAGANDDWSTTYFSTTSENYSRTNQQPITTEVPKPITRQSTLETIIPTAAIEPVTIKLPPPKNKTILPPRINEVIDKSSKVVVIKTNDIQPTMRASKATLPPLVFEPITTEEIIRKVMAKTTATVGPKKVVLVPIHYPKKPFMRKPVTLKYDDVISVPKQTTTDATEIFSPTPKLMANLDSEFEKQMHGHFVNSETLKERIVIENDQPRSKFFITLVAGLGFVSFCIISVILIVKRHSIMHCLRMRKFRNSSNGDSQSDVRFLTSDEALDFRLARATD